MIGTKIPIYMEQIGLTDVNVRVNDFVEFVSHKSDSIDFETQRRNFIENNLFDYQGKDADHYICARCHLISYGKKYEE